jgi:hypothetical protein
VEWVCILGTRQATGGELGINENEASAVPGSNIGRPSEPNDAIVPTSSESGETTISGSAETSASVDVKQEKVTKPTTVVPKRKHSRNPIKGQWAVRTLKEAKKSIIKLGIFENNEAFELMELVFNKNTKNPIPNQKIALLHIDIDLYEGYKYALEIFWDQIQIGGIILFDEYNHPRWPGATKAVNEFLVSKNINHHQKEIKGKYFIIKE